MEKLDVAPRQEFMGFDHIDTRVPSLAQVEGFYDKLMPLLGLTRKRKMYVDDDGEWLETSPNGGYNTVEYYTPPSPGEATFFIGFIERPDTASTWTRIAFRVEREALDEWLTVLRDIGASRIEPSEDMESYPAIFFEDPAGTKLELVCRHAH